MKYLGIGILLFFMACKGQKNNTNTLESSMPNSTELTLILNDNYGGTETPGIQVIREPGALKGFFAKINKTRKPGIPIPKIDFTKEMVVVYCSGKTNGTGSPVLYTKKETDKMMVLGVKKENNKEVVASSAIIMPFGIYTLPHIYFTTYR